MPVPGERPITINIVAGAGPGPLAMHSLLAAVRAAVEPTRAQAGHPVRDVTIKVQGAHMGVGAWTDWQASRQRQAAGAAR